MSSHSFIKYLQRLCVIITAVCCCGCAASHTTVIDDEVVTNPKPMYVYKKLIIKDLLLNGEADSALAEGVSQERYSKLAGELSQHIERYVKSHNIYKNVSRDGKSDAATLVLTGRFTRLGRFKISITVRLIDGKSGQEVAYLRQTLWDVLDTTDSVSSLGRDIADFISRIQYK